MIWQFTFKKIRKNVPQLLLLSWIRAEKSTCITQKMYFQFHQWPLIALFLRIATVCQSCKLLTRLQRGWRYFQHLNVLGNPPSRLVLESNTILETAHSAQHTLCDTQLSQGDMSLMNNPNRTNTLFLLSHTVLIYAVDIILPPCLRSTHAQSYFLCLHTCHSISARQTFNFSILWIPCIIFHI